MGKNINIDSSEWCDMVFADRNKSYGAFRLRQSSGKRHIVAYIVVVVIVAVISAIPLLVGAVKQLTHKENLGPMKDTVELSKVEVQEIPKENIIKQDVAPPPPPLRSTIQFVPPVIARDEEVTDDAQMKTQDEVIESRLQISTQSIKGDDDKIGMDIAEINKNRDIAGEKPVEDKPFVTVEQMPSFPGGEVEMQKFIRDNLKYPVIAQENGIQGRVTIRFVVTKDGTISDVQVLRGIDASCDKEAVRVVKAMPRWIPGKQNGRNVPVYFTLPVIFKLN